MPEQQPEVPAITQAQLAEALERELDSSWAGGRELAVNVFAYAREHYEPAGETGDPAEKATVLCPGCLHDGVLGRALERAERAEAKLAAIEAACRNSGLLMPGTATTWVVTADRILAIIGTGEKPC